MMNLTILSIADNDEPYNVVIHAYEDIIRYRVYTGAIEKRSSSRFVSSTHSDVGTNLNVLYSTGSSES